MKISELSRQVVADDAGRLALIRALIPELVVTDRRAAQRIGDRAGGAGVSEDFAQQQLAGFDRAALAQSSDASTPQRLIGAGFVSVEFREGDAAATVRGEYAFVEVVGTFFSFLDQLFKRQRAGHAEYSRSRAGARTGAVSG